jgi:predicted PurR-regulated permease PerM
MTSDQAAGRFFFLLLLVSVVLVALVAQPIATALFTAAVLAGVIWPVHERLSRRVRNHRGLSAGLFVLGVVILLVGPLVAFSAFAIKEVSEGVKFLSETLRSEGTAGLLDRLPPMARRLADRAIELLPGAGGGNIGKSVQHQVTAQGGKAVVALGAAISATGSLVFQAVMMLIAFYFLLMEGDKLVGWLDEVSPLKPGQTRELLAEFKKVSFAVVVSSVITSGVQAVAALIGYFIAQVPHPIFFAGVTFFAAFIPAVGAGMVCLVAALLLYVSGHPYAALFLVPWGLIVVGLVDNLVKPFLIKAGMEMHGAVVFFALVGGISAFGSVGLLLGPLAVALFLTLLRMYQRDFKTRAGTPGRSSVSHR